VNRARVAATEEVTTMKSCLKVLLGIAVLMVLAGPALAAEEWVARFSEVLAKAPAEGDWQVKTDDLGSSAIVLAPFLVGTFSTTR
jgi:hypothetical protein